MTETKTLARIERVDLGFEDHGIFGVNITFDFGDVQQGSGWYSLSNPAGGPLLEAILNAAGVTRWESLKGRTVYVLKEGDSYNALIVGFEKLPMDKQGGSIRFTEVIRSATPGVRP